MRRLRPADGDLHADSALRALLKDDEVQRRDRRRRAAVEELTVAEGSTLRALVHTAGRTARGGAVAVGAAGILLAPQMTGVAAAQQETESPAPAGEVPSSDESADAAPAAPDAVQPEADDTSAPTEVPEAVDPPEEVAAEDAPLEQAPTEQPPTEQPPTEQPPTEQAPTEQAAAVGAASPGTAAAMPDVQAPEQPAPEAPAPEQPAPGGASPDVVEPALDAQDVAAQVADHAEPVAHIAEEQAQEVAEEQAQDAAAPSAASPLQPPAVPPAAGAPPARPEPPRPQPPRPAPPGRPEPPPAVEITPEALEETVEAVIGPAAHGPMDDSQLRPSPPGVVLEVAEPVITPISAPAQPERGPIAVDPVFSPNDPPQPRVLPHAELPPSAEEQIAASQGRPVDTVRVQQWSQTVTQAWDAIQRREATPAPLVAVSDAVAETPSLGWSYQVKAGDSLWSIAQRLWGDHELTNAELDATWKLLYRWNAEKLGNNPDLLTRGVVLQIPADISGQA